MTKTQIKKLSTADLVDIVNAHIDKFMVFAPPSLSDVSSVCINGDGVQLNVDEEEDSDE